MRVSKRTGKRVLRKRVYRKKPTRVSKNVKQYVKKYIHSQIENKHVNIERAQTFGGYLQDTTLGMFPVCPFTSLYPVPIGTTQGTRIGNKIKTRRVTLNYVIRPQPYAAGVNDNPQPYYVLLFLGNYKESKGLLPGSLQTAQLYDNGSGSLAPASDLGDLVADINKDAWNIVWRKTEKVGAALSAGPGNLPNFSQFANNDVPYSVVRRNNITRHCPKTITFNDSSGSQQGSNMFFFYYCVTMSGSVLPATQRPLAIDYWCKYEYEDA